MRTLLKTHDCILNSEYRPIEKCKEGEKTMHQNRVESITFFKDKYDYNGNYIGTEKIVIDSHFLSEIRKTIEEVEQDKKIMTYDAGFSF